MMLISSHDDCQIFLLCQFEMCVIIMQHRSWSSKVILDIGKRTSEKCAKNSLMSEHVAFPIFGASGLVNLGTSPANDTMLCCKNAKFAPILPLLRSIVLFAKQCLVHYCMKCKWKPGRPLCHWGERCSVTKTAWMQSNTSVCLCFTTPLPSAFHNCSCFESFWPE